MRLGSFRSVRGACHRSNAASKTDTGPTALFPDCYRANQARNRPTPYYEAAAPIITNGQRGSGVGADSDVTFIEQTSPSSQPSAECDQYCTQLYLEPLKFLGRLDVCGPVFGHIIIPAAQCYIGMFLEVQDAYNLRLIAIRGPLRPANARQPRSNASQTVDAATEL